MAGQKRVRYLEASMSGLLEEGGGVNLRTAVLLLQVLVNTRAKCQELVKFVEHKTT